MVWPKFCFPPENDSSQAAGFLGIAEKFTLDVPHDEVDGQDDRDTDEGDDEHEHQKVSLEPDVLDRVDAALPEDHVVTEGEHAGDPGAHPPVNLGHGVSHPN